MRGHETNHFMGIQWDVYATHVIGVFLQMFCDNHFLRSRGSVDLLAQVDAVSTLAQAVVDSIRTEVGFHGVWSTRPDDHRPSEPGATANLRAAKKGDAGHLSLPSRA